ncbi:MAG: 5'-methylthioadenosine nucleosidase [Salinibacter sp.]
MLGIVFATSEEAAPFVEQYAAGRVDDLDEGQPIRVGDVVLTVTGPGKIKATLGTEQFLQRYDLNAIVHAGGATALSDEHDVAALVGATFVLEGDRVALDTPVYPRMPLDSPFDLSTEGTLVTQDHVDDEDPEARSYWERIADVRDDTGYAVAYVAAQHGTTCHIVKGITGHIGADSDPGARRDAYEAVASFLHDHVETAPPKASS